MAVCYNKLWKILIDRGMSKTELIKAAKISTNAMAKLGKNEDVRVEVLVKICELFCEAVPNRLKQCCQSGYILPR